MNPYDLPTSVIAGDQELHIRNDGDYRMCIDVNIALTDRELTEVERIYSALLIFYDIPNIDDIRNIESAVNGMMEFLNAGTQGSANSHKLVDWHEDAMLIISGVNSVVGHEIRAERYIHWWTFIAAYMAIGESALSTVVEIRDKIARGKKLESWENDFRKQNPHYFSGFKSEKEADFNMLLELIG